MTSSWTWQSENDRNANGRMASRERCFELLGIGLVGNIHLSVRSVEG